MNMPKRSLLAIAFSLIVRSLAGHGHADLADKQPAGDGRRQALSGKAAANTHPAALLIG
jgi:predicted component of type VI protein secretion system